MNTSCLTRDGTELPLQVADLLRCLLPTYQDNRQRWPLWTFEPIAWRYGGEPVFEVYRWTPSFLYRMEFPDYGLHGWMAVDYLPEAVEEMTYGELSILTAIAASQAMDVPDDIPEILLVDKSAPIGLVPDLVEPLEIQLRGALGDMFWDFLRAYEDAAYTETEREEENIPDPPRPRELAMEFCERAGLVKSRDKGKKRGITDRTLVRLREELQDAIDAIRAYDPSSDECAPLARRALVSDPGLGEYEKERIDRAPEKNFIPFQLQMRFPFLTQKEIADIRNIEIPRVVTALGIIANRLPGDIDSETIRNRTVRSSR